MKELEMLVSSEARHCVARLLTARGTLTRTEDIQSARERDRGRIRERAARMQTEHGEADYKRFLRLRCAELMFTFYRASNIAAEYGDAELMQAYETLAEAIGPPDKALFEYHEIKKRSPDDANVHTYVRTFLQVD